MIIASTGEVCFEGVHIAPHAPIHSVLDEVKKVLTKLAYVPTRKLPVEGWSQHELGMLESNHGRFDVEVVTDQDYRVQGVFLSHHHSFYDPATPDDAERRVYHDGVIASDLRGQREFPWGHVFCRVDAQANRDWLVVIYNPFSQIPLHAREVYKQLFAHKAPPAD